MSSQIVFDTNYLRSLGSKEYLRGLIPEKLQSQIELALNRGDIVSIPKTVQIELNAWISKLAEREMSKARQAWELLKEKGYSVSPEFNVDISEVDVFSIIKEKYSDVYLLEPSIENYADAEKRASYRLPPLPKNPEGEEFRDRIIWSQLVELSKNTDLPIVIVSGDRVFENGANSEEGKEANINIVKTEDDLNQWLDQRSPIIQSLIDDILLFTDELKENNIVIDKDTVSKVLDYRSVRDPIGNLARKFVLVTNQIGEVSERIIGKLLYHGSVPTLLSLHIKTGSINVYRKMSEKEAQNSELERQMTSSKKQFLEAELKNLMSE